VARPAGEELVLYDVERDAVHVLNDTAAEVYRLHDAGMGPEEISRVLRTRRRGGEERDVLADVRRCLEELRALGVLA